jgi:hypothetical protein
LDYAGLEVTMRDDGLQGPDIVMTASHFLQVRTMPCVEEILRDDSLQGPTFAEDDNITFAGLDYTGLEVTMRDDGLQGPDIVTDDGIYSGYFYQTTRDPLLPSITKMCRVRYTKRRKKIPSYI